LRAALDSRVFARSAIRLCRSKTEYPLLSFRPPSENAAQRAAAASLSTEIDRENAGSSREVPSPTASPRPGQRHEKVNEHPTLDRPPPSGFLNLVASSSAPDLLALFHARSAPGVLPSELCSSRAAVRRFRRLCPPVVGTPFLPVRTLASRRERRSTAPSLRAPWWTGHPDVPRLQGFAPHESPPLRAGCLRRRERVALLGFPPSGYSPSPEWHDLHRALPS
jgi:hypothetical protein